MEARYAGDANYAPSESTPVQVTVTPEASNTTVKVLTADASGNPIPFTSGPYGTFVYPRADVAGQSGFGTPTGQMNFLDNGNYSGLSLTLNSQGNTAPSNGVFTFSAGTHALSAMYLGDASFQPNTASSPVSFTITKAATTAALQVSGNTIASGSPVTLTANIDTSSLGNPPSGNVSFFNAGTLIPGSSAPLFTVANTNGTLQSTANVSLSLPNGQNSITAQYGGDTNYTGSTSTATTVTVAPDFTPTFGGPSITVASPGGSGNLTFTITGQTGYTGTINLSASSCAGLPFGAACSFSPASITGSGQSMLTVTTTAPTTRMAPGSSSSALTGGSGMLLAGLFVIGVAPRRRRWASAVAVVVIAWLLTVVGCSGGGPSTVPGTPTGTSTITVNVTDGNFKHSTTFTLNVQ